MTAYTFDQLITFTRTSAATYVGSNGLVAVTPASRNLLTYTQEFDNAAWIKGGGIPTVTANSIAAPDGTMTADTIAQASSVNSFSVSQIAPTATIGLPYTWSVYLKAGTSRYAQLTFSGSSFGTTQYANIDLQTGTVTASAGSPTVAITSVGNGWYRVAYTAAATAAAAATPFIVLINSATDARVPTITGSSANTIYVWGAQLEAASAASTYTRNNGGVYPPRFDYDPVTRAPRGLLIEEQRTNLVLRSEEFDNASWSKTNATVTANATTSPDGTADADKLVEDTSTNVHFVRQSVTVVASTTYTYSVYLKAAERGFAQVRYENSGSTQFFAANVDLSSGAVTTASFGSPTGTAASATNAGNGWWRVNLTVTASNTTFQAIIFSQAVSGTNSYTGDGTSGIYLWGAQLEAGAFATSYIPTVASQVTRTRDEASITAPMFAPWYRQSEGTFVVQAMTAIGLRGGSQGLFSANDGTTSNVMNAARLATGFVRFNGTGSPAGDVTSVASAANGAVSKMAFAFKANDWAMSLNGAAAVTDTSAVVPAVTRLGIGSLDGLFDPGALWGGHIQSVDYYPTRLTNAQIQALTA